MNVLDTEAFMREMFEADSSIRYVAIVDLEYRILASKHRAGISRLTPDDVDHHFVSIVPQIILEAVEKLSPFLGQVEGVTAHYKKVLLIFYRFEDLIVCISFEPDRETPFYNKITELFRKLSKLYLAHRRG